MKVILSILIVFSLSILTIVSIKKIILTKECTDYLKQAADANTVEIALQPLNKAIQYLEDNQLTSGHTSILWETPDENIGFWYNNLKQSQIELMKVNGSTSSLEKTNLLMNLRGTLLEGSGTVIEPSGLSKYPHNLMWSILIWISIISIDCILVYLFWNKI